MSHTWEREREREKREIAKNNITENWMEGESDKESSVSNGWSRANQMITSTFIPLLQVIERKCDFLSFDGNGRVKSRQQPHIKAVNTMPKKTRKKVRICKGQREENSRVL